MTTALGDSGHSERIPDAAVTSYNEDAGATGALSDTGQDRPLSGDGALVYVGRYECRKTVRGDEQEGGNLIQIRVEDATGNVRNRYRNINFDFTAPQIETFVFFT